MFPWRRSTLRAAVTEGLAHRADVAALRMLAGNLDADTLPAARSGMQAVSPGLGIAAGGDGLFGGSDRAAEASSRQSQVQQALAETQRTATREIHDAVAKLETSLREIALAKQRWEQWKDRVADLQEKHASDGATAFDLTTAQLELLRAENDAVHRIIAWKIAQAKLAQAQGLLAAQCGYCLP